MGASADCRQQHGFWEAALAHTQKVLGVSPAVDHEDGGAAAPGDQVNGPEDEENEEDENEGEEEEEIQADVAVNPPVKMARDPGAPSREEVEAHYMCHLPCRAWCLVCVQAKGKEDAHRKRKNKRAETEIPQIAYDDKSVGESIERDDKCTMLIARGKNTNMTFAHRVPITRGWRWMDMRQGKLRYGYSRTRRGRAQVGRRTGIGAGASGGEEEQEPEDDHGRVASLRPTEQWRSRESSR